MEAALAVRDGIFWWVGNWAIFTMLDVGLLFGWRAYRNRRDERAEAERLESLDREESAEVEDLTRNAEDNHEKQGGKSNEP